MLDRIAKGAIADGSITVLNESAVVITGRLELKEVYEDGACSYCSAIAEEVFVAVERGGRKVDAVVNLADLIWKARLTNHKVRVTIENIEE